MRIRVSTSTEGQPISARDVSDFLQGLSTLVVGLECALSPEYAEETMSRVYTELVASESDVVGRLGGRRGRITLESRVADQAFQDLRLAALRFLSGQVGLRRRRSFEVPEVTLPVTSMDLVDGAITRSRSGADTFAIQWLRVGSLETQTVIARDLGRLGGRIEHMLRAIVGALGEVGGRWRRTEVVTYVLRESLLDDRSTESSIGELSIGVVVSGVSRVTRSLDAMHATGVEVLEDEQAPPMGETGAPRRTDPADRTE
jgi:hypothetical protein